MQSIAYHYYFKYFPKPANYVIFIIAFTSSKSKVTRLTETCKCLSPTNYTYLVPAILWTNSFSTTPSQYLFNKEMEYKVGAQGRDVYVMGKIAEKVGNQQFLAHSL